MGQFRDIINIAELAMQAVVHFMNQNNDDLKEYAEALKEIIIDFYVCMIQGIYLNPQNN